MEILQLSDDSSNESGSDSEIFVPSDTSDEGTFVFPFFCYYFFFVGLFFILVTKIVDFELSNYRLCSGKFLGTMYAGEVFSA